MTLAIKSQAPKFRLGFYFISHLRACLASLGKIIRRPFASLLTISVIGIALALPLGFYVMLCNVQGLVGKWQNGSAEITLYLNKDLAKIRINDLLHQLKLNPEIVSVEFIPAEQGLKQLQQSLNAVQAITALKTNPLPDVIIVRPMLAVNSSLAISQLVDTLQKLPEVDFAQLDTKWLQRFVGIVNLLKKAILAIGALLSLGVLLIVANTIRLVTQDENTAIAVLKLVGATNAFIWRPFLYFALWLGILGGLMAWGLVAAIIYYLRGPVAKLAMLYTDNFALHNVSLNFIGYMLLVSMVLSILGARISVRRGLRGK